MTNWLDIYREQYKDKLDLNTSGKKRNLVDGLFNRASGFEFMFEKLLSTQGKNFKILETGTTRNPQIWKDGNSGFLFSEMVKYHGGTVISVDIKKKACLKAKEYIPSDQYQVFCSDSIKFLEEISNLNEIDLFYLDSYDVDWADDNLSAEHHLKEFKLIEPHLKSGAIVAIDDNSFLLDSKKRTGKGRLIYEYLKEKNILPVYDKYQIIYIF